MARYMERLYQTATWLLACHLACITLLVTVSVYSTLAGQSSSPAFQSGLLRFLLSSPRTILFTLPCFLFCRSKHYWLYNSRINGAEPAPTHLGRFGPLGLGWLLDIQAAIKEHRFFTMLDGYFARSGPTLWVQVFSSWALVTRDHEIVKAMYDTQHDDWDIGGAKQAATVVALGRHSIFANNGPEWKHERAMIRPSFVRNQLADLECTDRHVDNFLMRLPRDSTRTLDVQDLLYMFTMDISTDFMFGHSTNTLTNPTVESTDFSRCFDLLLLTASNRAKAGWFSVLGQDKTGDAVIRTCNHFVDAHVAKALQAEKSKERAYVFMDELIQSGASHEEIRSQLLSMIVGGRDTGASTLSSMLWILARRPDIVDKIREELEILDGRKPTWDELRNLKYLNNVLKETLRLHAPVASNSRIANKDTVLPTGGGKDGKAPLFVPKGTSVRFSTHHIHRDKSVYGDDAEEFRPGRWDTLRPKWGYIPFVGGPRKCIGQQFALTQMLYLSTRLFQTFSGLEAGDDKPMVQQVGTTMRLVNGCWIRLIPASEQNV